MAATFDRQHFMFEGGIVERYESLLSMGALAGLSQATRLSLRPCPISGEDASGWKGSGSQRDDALNRQQGCSQTGRGGPPVSLVRCW